MKRSTNPINKKLQQQIDQSKEVSKALKKMLAELERQNSKDSGTSKPSKKK